MAGWRNRAAAAAVGACLAAGSAAGDPAPRRVLIVGDSLMRILSHSLALEAERRPGIQTESFSSIGSGLARLDVFDWMAKIRELAAGFTPDAAIVIMGANDRQPLLAGGRTIPVHDPAWEAEYARRAGEAMDLLLAGGARTVYWIELPDMRETQAQENARAIRRIQRAEADKRPAVRLIPSDAVLSRTPGQYHAHVIRPGRMPILVRDPDGIHLSRAGADLLAEHVAAEIWGTR